jgi:RNA polymerase sigma-70 factor (ECF subfamily)
MGRAKQKEHQLVARAIGGDAAAFGTLYEHNMDAIYRYIYFRVEHTQEAEDLTEQVFLNAWQALPDYEPRGFSFASWLYRIAHNVVVDYQRQGKFLADGETPETLVLADDKPTSLEQVIANEERQRLAGALRKLPEMQRDVILLRFVEGLSHDEVAAVVAKSPGACRTIQYRALLALETLLAGEKVSQR